MTDTEIKSPTVARLPEEKPEPKPARGRLGRSREAMARILVGSVLADRYKLVRFIGEGGMGWVYEGEHTAIGKKCAVKILRPSHSHLEEAVARFRREARAATKIGSQHIIDITDFGTTTEGATFFVMEYLDGQDLSQVVKSEGAIGHERAIHMLLQICETLQAAHDAGIVHRDVKPANFHRVARTGNPDFIKVLDFGIARLLFADDSVVTQTGVVMGTPGYMAPEQAQGEHVDHHADIYSLGACAYTLLTGKAPFAGKGDYDVLLKQLNEDPEPPSKVAPDADIPEWLDAIVLKAMNREPEDRYSSMRELADALTAGAPAEAPGPTPAESSSAPAAQPPGASLAVYVVGAMALATAAGLAYFLMQ